jgi:tagatose 6-phosphate kinase
VCVTLLERRGGRVTELVEEAAPPRPAEWRALMEGLSSAIPRAGVVTLTGALMPGAPPRVYRKIAGMAAVSGARLVVDSQGEPLLEALRERPALAKLNVRELENTLGARPDEPAAIIAGARGLLSLGAACVVVTHGRRGAWLVSGDGCWRLRSPAVPVCNPIGSGDAMTAGIALALARGRSIHDAARLGVACGAANAMTPEAGAVRLSDVRRLLPLVAMESCGDGARGRRVRR